MADRNKKPDRYNYTVFFYRIKNIVLDIFFPPFCVACRAYKGRDSFLCDSCAALIKQNTAFFCPLCKNRLPQKILCHPKIHYILGAAGNYDDPVLQIAIHGFKYERIKSLSAPLGNILIDYLEGAVKNWDILIQEFLIIPIPLHPRRERERGFNQSLLLAGKVGEHFDIPVVQALRRVKNNSPQVSIKGREARKKNIAGVFKVDRPDLISNKNVILIDDVFTSGATMNEAVQALKDNGAKRIIALVLARA